MELVQEIGMYAAMVVAVASLVVKLLDGLVDVTPLEAEDVRLPTAKRVVAKAKAILDKLALNPKKR